MPPGGELAVHPAAQVFSALAGAELAALAADIKANGLQQPIVLCERKILDGRNRLAACEQAGVKPRFISLDVPVSPWAYVWSANAERRHLPEGQKAALGLSIKAKDAEWQAKALAARAKANKSRSEKQKGVAKAAVKERLPSVEGTRSATAAAIAAELGVSTRNFDRATTNLDRAIRELLAARAALGHGVSEFRITSKAVAKKTAA
jgi:flagellin-like hook-associated protein FlgL